MDGWKVRLLGALSAQRREQSITRFRTQKTASLFAFLAFNSNQHHAREALADRFWPDLSPDAARLSLNTAVHSLRKQLEPPGVPRGAVLIGDRFSLRLNPDAVETDVARFESLLSQARRQPGNVLTHLSHAIEEYRGELLPGIYDDWIDTPRLLLAEAYRGALSELAALLGAAGEQDAAIPYARRAAELDRYDPKALLALMGYLTESGNPEAAKDVYRAYKKLLKAELGLEPGPEVRDEARATVRLPKRLAPPAPRAPTRAEPAAVTVAGHLPLQFTRFFGRGEEIGQISRHLDADARLITLTGIGGAGKSRLAVELGKAIQSKYPGGVWFIPLADLVDSGMVTPRVRDSLGLPRVGHLEPLDQIEQTLRSTASLLLLDNLEQFPTVCAGEILALLGRIPGLQIVATTRRKVNLAGEIEINVLPLPVPTELLPGSEEVESIADFPSVGLFVDRAMSALPDFQLTSRLAPAVATVCRHLEGIPLALELAAARAQTMTVGQIAEGLSQRLSMAAPATAGKDPRHRSLGAALEWSFCLLSERMQRLLLDLCVFRGGFTADAVSKVCSLSNADTVELLSQLRAQSLLQSEEAGGALRFRMLEVTREFGLEKLNRVELWELRSRHAAYFSGRAAEAEKEFEGPRQTEWLNAFDADCENVRLTAEFFVESNDGKGAIGFGGSVWKFWRDRGHLREGRDWLERFLSLPDAEKATAERGHALNGLATLCYFLGEHEAARAHYEAAIAIREKVGDPMRLAGALSNLGNVLTTLGELEAAKTLFRKSLALSNSSVTLNNLARAEYFDRNFPAARAAFEEALRMDQEAGVQPYVAYDLVGLGIVCFYCEEYDEALSLLDKSLQAFREARNESGIAFAICYQGLAHLRQGKLFEAATCISEALELSEKNGLVQRLIGILEATACWALGHGDSDEAATLLGGGCALRAQFHFRRPPCDQVPFESAAAEARKVLGDAVFSARFSAGERLDLEAAVALAKRLFSVKPQPVIDPL